MYTDHIDELIEYDSETGEFFWKESVKYGNRCKPVGGYAGSYNDNGHKYIGINGKQLIATKIAWYKMRGIWPNFNLTYKDGDMTNFRWNNIIPSKFWNDKILKSASATPGIYVTHDGWFAKLRNGGSIGPYAKPHLAHNARIAFSLSG